METMYKQSFAFFNGIVRFVWWGVFFTLLPLTLWAQTECTSEFDFDVLVTPSSCQSNGTIKVTLKGAYDNFTEFHYSVEQNENHSAPKVILPQRSNLLKNLPRGRHRVRVSGLCKSNDKIVQFKEKDVFVGGDYQVIEIFFNEQKSVSSYKNCITGDLVFDLKGGNGNYTFTIEEAPATAGLTLPYTFVPTREGESYKVPTKLSAGQYLLSVKDDCYEQKIVVNLKEFSEMPFPNNHYEVLIAGTHTLGYTYDCNRPMVTLETKGSAELFRRIDEGEFEIGLAEVGKEVPVGNWEPYRKWYGIVYLQVPRSALYEGDQLDVVVRSRICPSVTKRQTYQGKTWIPQESISAHTCTQYKCKISGSYSSLSCYPVTVKLYKDSKNNKNLIHTMTLPKQEVYSDDVILDYDKKYIIAAYDAHGVELTKTEQSSYIIQQQLEVLLNYVETNCQGFAVAYSLYKFPEGCYPLRAEWVNQRTGNVDFVQLITSKARHTTETLSFDTNYVLRLKVPATGKLVYTMENPILVPADVDVHLGFNTYSIAPNRIKGYFSLNIPQIVYVRNGRGISIDLFFQTDKYEIEWPDGKTVQFTRKNNWYHIDGNALTNVYFDLPKGTYKLRIFLKDCMKELSFDNPGDAEVKYFNYSLKRTCEGMHILPEGLISMQGYDVPFDTKFRLIDPPVSYKGALEVPQGGEFIVREAGVYKMTIRYGSYIPPYYDEYTGQAQEDYFSYDLDTVSVRITFDEIQLSPNHTMAYACENNQNSRGHIFVKATGGVPPYRYELWNANNTQRIAKQPTIDADGVAYYQHGRVNEQYTIRIIDACGANFAQNITIYDLSQMRIASTPESMVCNGENILLRSLPALRYEWRNPQGKLFSREQNPRIFKASRQHSGRYELRAIFAGCGKEVYDYVNINVEPCWAPVNPNLMHRVGSMKSSAKD